MKKRGLPADSPATGSSGHLGSHVHTSQGTGNKDICFTFEIISTIRYHCLNTKFNPHHFCISTMYLFEVSIEYQLSEDTCRLKRHHKFFYLIIDPRKNINSLALANVSRNTNIPYTKIGGTQICNRSAADLRPGRLAALA